MHLWIGVHLPHLCLEVFRPTWSAEHGAGLVVLEHQRVLAMNRSARDAGIRPGMRRGGVMALLAEVRLETRDPVREAAALQGLAVALMQYSPQLALTGTTSLAIDVSASLRLFGGIRALYRRVRQTIATCGFSARISLAPTGAGALLLARAGAGHALHPAGRRGRSLDTVINGLPLGLLEATQPYDEWFVGLGCRTLGDLRQLPRAGLKRRCGSGLLDNLDQALGHAPASFDWLTLPPQFTARQELPDRIDNAATLHGYAMALLAQLVGWLSASRLAVRCIVLSLEHERGRQAVPPTDIVIALAEATWHDEHLCRLLRERLAHTPLTAAILAMSLRADTTETAVIGSDTLFPEPGGNFIDHCRLLELLSARLGPRNLLHATARHDHRPEVANHWQNVSGAVNAAPCPPSAMRSPAPSTGIPFPPRPAWLLAEPLALLTRHHRPFYGSTLRILSAGERIESGWWDGYLVTRDYFVALADDHSYYWIYKERLIHRTAATSSPAAVADMPPGAAVEADEMVRWYLHGLFG